VSSTNRKSIFIFLGSLTGGGAERVASTLSKYLSHHRGYKVTLVTLGSKKRDFYKLDASVNRIAMDLDGETAGLNKFTHNIQRVINFRKLLTEEQPDLVIAFMTRYAIIALIASLFKDVKIIVSERNYPPKRVNHGMWEILRKYIYKYADLHVVQTELIAEWIKDATNSESVTIIPNSITWPITEHEPVISPDDILNRDDSVILAAGTIKHQKGFDLLLKGAGEVLKEKPDWKLVIIGDEKNEKKELTKELSLYVQKSGLSNQVIFAGRAGNIGAWYERAKIFVLSSRYEGFPNVLLEGMASGCACISFDCKTGPAEMITHYENGILVPAGDTDELSKELRILTENDELRKSLGENAINVRQRFSEESIMDKWQNTIEKILN